MDPVAEARRLLPLWVPWLVLLTIPVAFGAAWLLSRALCSIAFRRVLRSANAHWTDRARMAWPARQLASFASLVVSMLLGAALSNSAGPLSLLSSRTAGVLSALAALVGFVLGALPVSRRLRAPAPVTVQRHFQSVFSLWLLRLPQFLVAVVFAVLMPARFGWTAFLLLVFGTAAVYATAFGGSLAFGRLVGLLRPAGERLRRVVADVATASGVPVPDAVELKCLEPVAFALPIRRKLVFSDATLALLDDAELAAIAAHEVGHLTESRAVTVQRASSLLLLSLLMAGRPLSSLDGRPLFFILLFVLLGLVAIGAFSRRTWRQMETRADAHAAAHDAAHGTYAHALERMHEAGLVPAVLRKRGATHPDLWDRMLASGLAPSWPKPEPPRPARIWLAALILPGLFVAAEFIRGQVVERIARSHPLAAVAATGGEPSTLSRLARRRYAERRYEEAVALSRAASRLGGHTDGLSDEEEDD